MSMRLSVVPATVPNLSSVQNGFFCALTNIRIGEHSVVLKAKVHNLQLLEMPQDALDFSAHPPPLSVEVLVAPSWWRLRLALALQEALSVLSVLSLPDVCCIVH